MDSLSRERFQQLLDNVVIERDELVRIKELVPRPPNFSNLLQNNQRRYRNAAEDLRMWFAPQNAPAKPPGVHALLREAARNAGRIVPVGGILDDNGQRFIPPMVHAAGGGGGVQEARAWARARRAAANYLFGDGGGGGGGGFARRPPAPQRHRQLQRRAAALGHGGKRKTRRKKRRRTRRRKRRRKCSRKRRRRR